MGFFQDPVGAVTSTANDVAHGVSSGANAVVNTVSSGVSEAGHAAGAAAKNPINAAISLAGGGTAGYLVDTFAHIIKDIANKKSPNISHTGAPPPPSQSMANDVAYASVLKKEQSIRQSSPLVNFGGGAGLLDNPTTTSASSILLGS